MNFQKRYLSNRRDNRQMLTAYARYTGWTQMRWQQVRGITRLLERKANPHYNIPVQHVSLMVNRYTVIEQLSVNRPKRVYDESVIFGSISMDGAAVLATPWRCGHATKGR